MNDVISACDGVTLDSQRRANGCTTNQMQE